MAWKRSTVRTRPGPPNVSNTYDSSPVKSAVTGVQLESRTVWCVGSLGHVWAADTCPYLSLTIQGDGTLGHLGSVFHACCLLEKTTFCFLYRRLPISPKPETLSIFLADSL